MVCRFGVVESVLCRFLVVVVFFFFKQKTAYEMLRSLVGSEMCIRDSPLVDKIPPSRSILCLVTDLHPIVRDGNNRKYIQLSLIHI